MEIHLANPRGFCAGVDRAIGIVERALDTPDENLSNFAPGFAIACARHETQYSRLFRS